MVRRYCFRHFQLKSPRIAAEVFRTMKTPLRTLLVILFFFAAPARSATPPAHLDAECSACHKLDRSADASVAVAERANGCGGCHGANGTAGWGAPSFHDGDMARCTTCHSFHESDRVRITTGTMVSEMDLGSLRRGAAARDLAQCTPCHRSGGPSPTLLHPGHQAAALWYHANVATVGTQSISESCLRCHDRDQALPEELPAGFDPPRPSRAASHVHGVPVASRARGGYGTEPPTDPRLRLVQGRVECTTCHDLYNTSNDMLAQFEPRDGMCLGCHVRSYDGSTSPERAVLAR